LKFYCTEQTAHLVLSQPPTYPLTKLKEPFIAKAPIKTDIDKFADITNLKKPEKKC